MNLLVTGGAGYIGAFVARRAAAEGHHVVVVDNLSRGHREAVDGLPLATIDCADAGAVEALLRQHRIEAVIHLAGLSQVGESMSMPARYWSENVGGSARLLDVCRGSGVMKFVFSSSAAVYGEPCETPITESHHTLPTNPYGSTKRAIEQLLEQLHAAGGFDYVSLRYFNAAGAMPDGSLGESHEPETHLLPLAIDAALGRRGPLTVFGTDYDTPDGTCLRDYVHVIDLAEAHVRALDWLDQRPGQSMICNLGAGQASSVLELIRTVEAVSGQSVPHRFGPRRVGDPSVLLASIDRAQQELAWTPTYSSLAQIATDAWAWHRKHASV
jgi:UDP-glucose-4-epimerase GalE